MNGSNTPDSPTPDSREGVVRLAAVGDLLLTPAAAGRGYRRRMELISPEVREVLAPCNVVFANIECTLPGDGSTVPTEPRVVATPELVRSAQAAGISVVTLANNHVFDCLEGGFLHLRRTVKEAGLVHFGAGMNLEEAQAPAIIEANGLRLAFLGAVDHRSGPSRFADVDGYGVAPLEADRLVERIAKLRTGVDHVIVSVHWGEERFLVPSPLQIQQARSFVDAGASMVLGHHPHVVQGLEIYRDRPIIYSLGNFIADDVRFCDGDVMRWNRTERTGCILLAELHRGGVTNVRQVPTHDPGDLVTLDLGRFGHRRIRRACRALARGVTLRRYRREYLWVKTIKPIISHLCPSRLARLRLRHFRNAIRRLLHARRAE